MIPGVLSQLAELEAILEAGRGHLETEILCTVATAGTTLPVHAVALGGRDPALPAVGFFGGVHGLERIGTEVVLAYLQSLVTRLDWDSGLHDALARVRLVFMPLVNPGGMWLGTRANPQGIDLMRNAPVEAREKVPFLAGGQRLSSRLPWYRGAAGAPLAAEARALCDFVSRELLVRPFSIAVDCHSGFGVHDRIWFPFAHTREPIPHLPELHALFDVYDRTHAHHDYLVEPQSAQYLAHGDLWDHLYLRAATEPRRIFLPLTLEMGSWRWVKKNPRQLFSRDGMFNPLVAHRRQRVLRRHPGWLDFVARAAAGWERWVPQGAARAEHLALANARWYGTAAT
ncbi:MAG: zinc carboxypeptidase [Gammaproteobacteria bacterium]|nr:zinc carboxypeptidase [Gammaproteobacteria bacterium]